MRCLKGFLFSSANVQLLLVYLLVFCYALLAKAQPLWKKTGDKSGGLLRLTEQREET
jgi:hypothetical protein